MKMKELDVHDKNFNLNLIHSDLTNSCWRLSRLFNGMDARGLENIFDSFHFKNRHELQ